ncbi:MAG: LysR family transcriptional regulator [Hyphomicrobiaceae bacterium]
MHIRSVDLNLIAVFDAIMTEGSLSAAGKRLGLSQSAVSHALARLRSITGDELFVRTRKGMRPTAHAAAIAGPLQSAVELCRHAFAARNSIAGVTDERTFVVDLPAGFDVVFVPPLLTAIQALGLGTRVWVNSDRAVDALTDLRDGETELALGLEPADAKWIRCTPLYDDEFLVCSRKGLVDRFAPLTQEMYLSSEHIALNWARGLSGSPVDSRMRDLKWNRKVLAALPTLAGCASVVAHSNVLFTIHSRIARILAARFDLQLHPMPFRLAPVTLYQIWHERFDDDPGHQWLRGEFTRIAREL